MPDDRSAALLVRVWFEEGSDQFRARVSAVRLDDPGDDRTVAVTSSPGDVVRAVGEWLDRFVDEATTG